jgi:hypothetical protein
MTLKYRSPATLAALLLALSSTLLSQAISGNVVGTIRENSGAVVVGAHVPATNIAIGIAQVATSGVDGDYTTQNVAARDYKTGAQMNVFTTAVTSKGAVQVQEIGASISH